FLRQSVMAPDFRDGNFLSTDQRIPVSVVKTNACRAVGTNAIRGHVWDNFSSETYKNSPASGAVWVYNPWTKDSTQWAPPADGRGYYRVPSLASIWASAPFLHNNALGAENHDPSVAGRMHAFDDAVQKLLWPERRAGVASISRTTRESYLQIPASYLPTTLRPLAEGTPYFRLGPIPAGTPINLLASASVRWSDSTEYNTRLIALLLRAKRDFVRIRVSGKTGDAAAQELTNLVPDLLAISNCPDFIEDKGHYFGTKLSDADKRALIEFLKTL
ncbi:MAG: hypothetical protein JO180_03880, partial [Gemmatirosa sp.]|nr:hypothetical protein [Gemmatirosa sp.]